MPTSLLNLFNIVAVLKSDLYKSNISPIPTKEINDILKECGLYIGGEKADGYAMQNYFWNTLQDKLIAKGYKIKTQDFTIDVDKYYARAKNRHRYYGFDFPVYETKQGEKVYFRIEIENDYYFGFAKKDNPNNEVFKEIITSLSDFKLSEYWYGWKYSNRYNLDFWNLKSNNIKRLENPRLREQLIIDIADEINSYITLFRETAKEKNL